MKFLLTALLLLFSVSAYSQTGIFFDQDRDGEGLLAFRDADRIVGYLFTYGAEDTRPYGPTVGPSSSEECCGMDGQRFFFFADDWIEESDSASGFIYATYGTSYPFGIQNPIDPFAVIVGEAVIVGIYQIKPESGGYVLLVARFGTYLAPDDPLYSGVFDFTDLLFMPTQ